MSTEASTKLERYSRFSRTVHWLSVLLIIGIFSAGFIGFSQPGPDVPRRMAGPPIAGTSAPTVVVLPPPGVRPPETDPFMLVVLHKELGLILLVLSVARLVYRLLNRVPALPADMPKWQTALARTVQALIYIGILLQPITGLIGSGRGFGFFRLFNVMPLMAAHPYILTLHAIHIDGAWVLLGLISLHAIGALYHHYIRKDRVLTSML